MPAIGAKPQFSSIPYDPYTKNQAQLKLMGDRVGEMVRRNPALAKDPYSVIALSRSYGVDPQQASDYLSNTKFLNAVHRSLWGNIAHLANNAWQGVNTLANTGWDILGNISGDIEHPTQAWRQLNTLTNSAWDATKNLALGGSRPKTAFDAFAPYLHDRPGLDTSKRLFHVVDRAANAVPASITAVISGIEKNGVAYTIGEQTPAIVLSMLSDGAYNRFIGGALTAEDVAGTNALIWQNKINNIVAQDKNLISGVTDWSSISAEQMAELAAANRRVHILDPEHANITMGERIKASESHWDRDVARRNARVFSQDNPLDLGVGGRAYANAPAAGEFFARNSGFIGRVLKATIGGVRKFNGAISGPGAQAFYLASSAISSRDNPDLWEAAVKGQIVRADGSHTNVGDYVANALIGSDSFFHTALAAALNIDLMFVVDDPLSQAFRIKGMTKSMYGFTGTLGAMFGGMAIRHPGDVYRAYSQYKTVRSAVDYIATHGASDIARTFRGLFNGSKILHELGAADSPEAVLNVFERINYGIDMMFTTMPQLSWYSLFKTRLTGSLEKYGFYGKLLENSVDINKALNEELKAMTDIDWDPRNANFQILNPAGKAKVLYRQRLRNQFMARSRWYNAKMGRETSTRIEIGDIQAIPAAVDRLVNAGADPLVARAWGDAMIKNADNPELYKRGFRNMMFIVLTNKIAASMPQAGFERFLKSMDEFLWAMTDNLVGVDGAGYDGWYIATDIEGFNKSLKNGKVSRAGIGTSHLGALRLPDVREIRNIQRQLAVIYDDLATEESYKILSSVDSKYDEIKQLAEFSVTSPEKIFKEIKKLEKPSLKFETANVERGYRSVMSEIMGIYEKVLTTFEHQGMTAAERIANVITDLEKRKVDLQQLQAAEKNGFDMRADLYARRHILPETVFNEINMTPEEIRIKNLASLEQLEELRGQLVAIENMMNVSKAFINTSSSSLEEINSLAHYMAQVRNLQGEALKKYVKDFKEAVEARREGRSFGTGKRNLRSRGQLITDWFQFWVNNRYFKPLALTSPAWATRVSTSEMLLNGLRVGGYNFFEAHVASSLAKNEFLLGKQAKLAKEEQSLLRNVISGIMMGIERELLDFSDPEKARLMDDAVGLMIRHDGHLPMGVHGHGDADADYNVDDGLMQQTFGLEGDSSSKNYHVRGTYGRIGATEAGAGTAFHENIIRITDDAVLGPVAREIANLVRLHGMDIFNTEMDKLMPGILREARKSVETGTGKIIMGRREKELEKLLDQWTEWDDFKTMNALEQEHILDQIGESGAKSVDDVTAEMVPAAYRDGFIKNGQFLGKLMEARTKLDAEIQTQEKVAEQLREIVESSEAKDMEKGARSAIKEELKANEAKQKGLAKDRERILKAIAAHPYAAMVGTIEGGTALKAYSQIKKDFMQELRDTVQSHLDEADNRLGELFGGNKVAVPRGGYSEMAGERFLVFTDDEGHVAANSALWEAVAEKYPQLWSNNEDFADYMRLGMPGAEGVDALAHILGLRPALFASYSNDIIGKAKFVEDYKKYSAALRSRNATREKRFAESWMRRNISAKKADWKLDAEEVWVRKAAMDTGEALPTHGLNPEEWFDEVLPMLEHRKQLGKASLYLSLAEGSRSHIDDAYKALKGIDPLMTNTMRDMPRLFDETFDGTSAYAIRGVPLDVLLGPGKKAKEALNDFAFHMRERVMLQDTKIFDKNFIPHYTPDSAGMKRFMEDWRKHESFIKEFERTSYKMATDMGKAASRDDRLAAKIKAREEFYESKFGDSNPGGAREYQMAEDLFPDLEHSFATLLSRLGGDYTLLKDLHIGQGFSINQYDGWDGKKALLKDLLGDDFDLSILRTESPYGEVVAGLDHTKLALTYAEAGKLYDSVQKRLEYFNSGEFYQSLADKIQKQIDADYEASVAAGTLFADPHLDLSIIGMRNMINRALGKPDISRRHGAITGLSDGQPFVTPNFGGLLADLFEQDKAEEILKDYLDNGLIPAPGIAARARFNLDALLRNVNKDLIEFPPELIDPEAYKLGIRDMARVAAESGSERAQEIIDANGWEYDRFHAFKGEGPSEDFIYEIDASTITRLGAGVTGQVWQSTTAAGEEYALKVYNNLLDPLMWNEANIEEAVSDLARHLDLPARDSKYVHIDGGLDYPGISDKISNRSDFVIHPLADVTAERSFKSAIADHELAQTDIQHLVDAVESGELPIEAARDIRAMYILDALIRNGDRHRANYLGTKDERIVAIDHGYAGHKYTLDGLWPKYEPGDSARLLNGYDITNQEFNYLDRRIKSFQGVDADSFKQFWEEIKTTLKVVDDSSHDLQIRHSRGFKYESGFDTSLEQVHPSDAMKQYGLTDDMVAMASINSLSTKFSEVNEITLGQMRKAAEAQDKLKEIVKPRWEKDKAYIKNDGTLPETLRYLPGDTSQQELFSGIRKTFDSSTARRLFGVTKPSSLVQGVAVKNLNSMLSNGKKYVKTVLAYEGDALIIKSMGYDPSSAASRRKAIDTMKAIMETADNYRMPTKIVVTPDGPEGVSAAIRNLDAWFGSFGFTGKPTKYADRIEFTRSPSGYGKRNLVDEDAKPAFAAKIEALKAELAAKRGEKYSHSEEANKAYEAAQKWFATFVEPIASGQRTPTSVWRRALDIDRNRVADQLNRDGYQELLEQLKDNGKAAARNGWQRGGIMKKRVPDANSLQSGFEEALEKQEQRLQSLREKSSRLDDRTAKNFAARDKVRENVVRQDDIMRERMIKKSVEFYARRERNAAVGTSKLARTINSRLGSINTAIEREVSRLVNDRVLKMGAAGFSGENSGALREAIEDIAYTHIKTMDPKVLERFDRDMGLLPPDLSTGDPHMDFAKTIGEHFMGLTTADHATQKGRELMPEILSAMETGNSPGPRKLAEWLADRKKDGKNLPGPFPAKKFISPFDKGSRASLLQRVSDVSHQRVLGPIVNELVREPMFVLEYHQQMEALRPFVNAGWMTMDQAEIKAEAAASINMMKYVHNPQDKLVWEQNWRVLAPFYFAKNQAMRRALRMAGDNMAAFEKYLKINLAVTDFVASSVSAVGTEYNIPGSQLVAGMINSLVGSFIMSLGYGGNTMTQNTFGFDASPSSVNSIVVTGTDPSFLGILKEIIHIPFGMLFTVPAKIVYENLFKGSNTAYEWMKVLVGETSMKSSIIEDFEPNSLIRNTVKGVSGFFGQDSAGSFQSTETWVISDIANQLGDRFYQEAKRDNSVISDEQLAMYGSKEELWFHLALKHLSIYMHDPDNAARVQAEAKWRTTFMWMTKTIGSFALPVAVNIGERFYNNQDFYSISQERDKQGDLKFPTLQMASDEFARRYPDKLFSIMSHTKSTGTSYLEVTGAANWLKENEGFAQKYSLISAYLIPYGKNEKFDSEALRIEMAMGLREKITIPKFMEQLNILYGDRYFSSLSLKYKMDPTNIDITTESGVEYVQALMNEDTAAGKLKVATGVLGANVNLTYNAFDALEREAKRYAAHDNVNWWGAHKDLLRSSNANDAFKELARAMDDPDAHEQINGKDRVFYQQMIDWRKTYVSDYKQYSQAGYSTASLRRDWYNQANEYANDPKYKKYISFIYGVMRRMPDPEPR